MVQRRHRGLLLLALLACTERQTEPSADGAPRPLDPSLAEVLVKSGVEGPVAVFERRDGADRSQVAFAGSRRFTARPFPKARPGLAFDIQEQDAFFIVNPRGPRMLRADSSITVGWSVLCLVQTPQGTQIFRSFDATINKIEQEAIDTTGGHLHTEGEKPVGAWTPDFGPLNANAEFVTTYISEIASGDERMTLRYTPHDTPCAGILDSVVFKNATRVRGLAPMAAYPHMYFEPVGSMHDGIYFIRPTDEARVHRVVDTYFAQSLQATGAQDSIKITSVSLKFGGLYDIDDNWATPHETHKLGTDVDMNGRTSTSPQQHQVIGDIGESVGGARLCEPHGEPVHNHVHCYFGPPYGPRGQ